MAATAYAAAVSLLNTMDQIQIHPLLSTYFNDNYSIESLREKVDSFANFVEKYSDVESEEAEDLLRRIADVAHEAEEMINVEAANRIRKDCIKETAIENLMRRMAAAALRAMPIKLQRAMEKTSSSMPSSSSSPPPVVLLGLQRITEEMNLLKEKVGKLQEGTGFITRQCTYSSMPSSSSAPPPYTPLPLASSSAPHPTASTKSKQHTSSMPSSSSPGPPATMVGFDGYVKQLLEPLTGHYSGLEILPIVGMGGIGKTTLATNVYHNSKIMRHFTCRIWVTVSQKFSLTKIYSQALSCLGMSTDDIDKYEDQQLRVKLHQLLFKHRYLVILDDVWNIEAWDKIKLSFPENNSGSRIVITTRQQELIHHFGSSKLVVEFLDDESSWELFCAKAFAQQGCPHHKLEQVGKKIVTKCGGLPLAIDVIGGLLRESPKTLEYWEKIAQDRSLILDSGEDNKLSSILNLSYKHLPVWLKPCFLYMGLFPEDYKIQVSEIIKLWIAEGFIRSKTEQTLEEVPENYAKQLIDRNLLLVRELRINEKLKSFRVVHDVVRELCIRIGEKEKYFCVRRDIDGMRNYIVDEATARLFYPPESQETRPSIVHPQILKGERAKLQPLKSRLLKVSLYRDRTNLGSYSQDVNLRYFNSGFEDDNAIHSSMQLFWSLQTLIIHHMGKAFEAPPEIWKMPQLRHIDMISISIPDPPSPTCEDDVIVLHNLQTLGNVTNFKLSREACKRIPNIKELQITYRFNDAEEASRCNSNLQNLGQFDKLETLQLYCDYPGGDLLPSLPSSITRLLLFECKLPWSDMARIATSLPHLQSLELWYQAFVGFEWNLGIDKEFPCLKLLRIILCDDLTDWNIAGSSNFPVLETLELGYLSKLKGIPSVIGEIDTLRKINLKCCESATVSAIEILKEQERLGNLSLQLTIYLDKEEEEEEEEAAAKWREITQLVGCQNLHFHIVPKF